MADPKLSVCMTAKSSAIMKVIDSVKVTQHKVYIEYWARLNMCPHTKIYVNIIINDN